MKSVHFLQGLQLGPEQNIRSHRSELIVRSPVGLLEAVHHPGVAALREKPTKSVSHSATLRAQVPPLLCEETRMEPGNFHTLPGLPGEVKEILRF